MYWPFKPSLKLYVHCQPHDIPTLGCTYIHNGVTSFLNVAIVIQQRFYSSNRIRKTQNDHRLSKFDRSVVMNFNSISYYLGVSYSMVFYLETIEVSLITFWFILKKSQFWREKRIRVLVILSQLDCMTDLHHECARNT